MFQRFWRRTAVALALAVPFLAAPGCRRGQPSEAAEVVPELKLEGVRFRVYRGDDLRAFGEASTATFRRDSTELSARDLVATLPRSPSPVHITAPRGEGELDARTYTASGGVVVARGDDVARTPSARFLPSGAGGTVEGDEPVVVEGSGYRLEGSGFTLDPATGDLAVRGGARLLAGEAR
jgi:lipopolysaccharide export system protein LptC